LLDLAVDGGCYQNGKEGSAGNEAKHDGDDGLRCAEREPASDGAGYAA
jgi:hypothetical protein